MKKEDMMRYYRSTLSEYSVRSFKRGLVGGAGGNLSLRIPGTNTVLITPTGISLEEITPEISILVDLDGNILESPMGHKGSKETDFHLSAYKLREDVQAVVHVHPPYSTAFSCTGKPLSLATISSRLILKNVPCIPCFNPGSKELADEVTSILSKDLTLKGILMQDHGILALGPDITTAYYLADLVEHTAQVAFLSRQIV
jgi:L-fuculose-phosphate aldolase